MKKRRLRVISAELFLFLVILSGAIRMAARECVFQQPSRFLVLALFDQGLGTLFGEGRFVEDIVGKAGIELTTVVKDLSGAASVVFPGDLKRRPSAVLQLVV